MVARVNVAWLDTQDELRKVIGKLRHDIYLDYPQGRTKPPKPRISLDETIAIAHQFPHIKYFAISNVEEPEGIMDIKKRLPEYIEIIPKIETVARAMVQAMSQKPQHKLAQISFI